MIFEIDGRIDRGCCVVPFQTLAYDEIRFVETIVEMVERYIVISTLDISGTIHSCNKRGLI